MLEKIFWVNFFKFVREKLLEDETLMGK